MGIFFFFFFFFFQEEKSRDLYTSATVMNKDSDHMIHSELLISMPK